MATHFLFAPRWMPLAVGIVAAAALLFWALRGPREPLQTRHPGADNAPQTSAAAQANPAGEGIVLTGQGVASTLPGSWPQFRGVRRDGTAIASGSFHRWAGSAPRECWSIEVGEGYAGPAVLDGRVYLMDYDREGQQDALRCLSLEDGREIWRFTYPIPIKRNHGMTRTVPAVQNDTVVAIGPKCHVICCDARTGELRWALDLVQDFGARVPEWYTGQCPLIDADHVILAPGGPEALLMAVRLSDGELVWQTPNPNRWNMTHSSIMPMDADGLHQYVYCARQGVIGVSAEDGSPLWETTEWKISIATVPSPCMVPDNRIFLTGGYNAGSLMLRLDTLDGSLVPRNLFRLDADTFGATQHTPVFHGGHLYGVRADGRLVCLQLDGRVAWESDVAETFGLGPFLLAGDVIYAMDDGGLLRAVKAEPSGYDKLAEAQVLNGQEAWGPMALVGDLLLLRDLTRLACLDLGSP